MPNSRPNVLWYCADQFRFDAIGALGNAHVHTPNLDRLVASGVAFTHAYCQAPICTPSRASFLTGKYPSTVRVNRNGNPTFPTDERLVTRRLADVGYDCGLVGKLHLTGAALGRERRTDDGYRFFEYSHAPFHRWLNGHDYADWIRAKGADPATVLPPGVDVHNDLKIPTPQRDNVPPELHQSTWCTERALAFIDQQREGPWLLSVNPFDPHPPFDPPWEFYRRFDPSQMPAPLFRESDLTNPISLAPLDFQTRPRGPDELRSGEMIAAYYAMIELIDEQFGRLIDALERSGQLADTLVIFTSDHGEMLGDHGLTHKGSRFYEGLVRVPLIMSWPGTVGRGVVSDALVELTDIAPTLMEAAGLPVPADTQGRSLLPMLTGESSTERHREFVRSEFYDALALPDATRATMYRDRRWKLVVYHDHGLGELFDLETDPGEFDNLWDHPAHQTLKLELLGRSFDASIEAMDRGPARVMPN
jgi:arylsulfatase A-like enzyme